jgi:hypothetical protein
MSDDRLDDPSSERPPSFDGTSPRWQENDAAPGEVERYRRDRIDARPHQRGAIDEDGSVPGSRDPAADEDMSDERGEEPRTAADQTES